MSIQESDEKNRAVLVQTVHGAVEGFLNVDSRLRTLDHLNVACPKFLTIQTNGAGFSGWSFGRGLLALNVESVLFVMELEDTVPTSDYRVEATRFTRTAIRLRVGHYDVQGFIHVTGLTGPLNRLNQNKQGFVALTAVSVIGRDSEFSTSFLAVNPRHIHAAQEIPIEQETSFEAHRAAAESGACV